MRSGKLQLFTIMVFMFSAIFFNTEAQFHSSTNLKGHVYAGSRESGSHTAVSGAEINLKSYSLLGDSISYSAVSDSDGYYAIDSVKSGIYSVRCSAKGYAVLLIRQYEIGDENENLNLFLRDTTGTNTESGIVGGKVRFKDSEHGVSNAIIEFIPENGTGVSYFATTNFMGMFMTAVPAGKYYVSCTVLTADSATFYQAYYKDAHTLADAKAITVINGEKDNDIDFEVPSQAELKSHSVVFNGKVLNDSGSAVSGATVKIWSNGEIDEHEFMRHNNGSLLATAKTDANGMYSVTLDSLSARFNTFIVGVHKEGYKVQFFNGEDEPYKADVLIGASDTAFSDINFTLTPNDNNSADRFSLSGTVSDSAGVGIGNAFVIAVDSASGRIRLAITDSNGNYTFMGMGQGSYYLMFYASGYAAQFYSGAIRWENATTVMLNGDVSGINVALIDSKSTFHGGGEFVGHIHSHNGSALSGVLITVKDSDDVTAGNCLSDSSGTYKISGLTKGTYTITASVSSYNSQQHTASYDPSSGSTQVTNFDMAPANVTAVSTGNSGNTPSGFVLENNYPNPFNPSTLIKFKVPESSHVTLDIFNILGQKVAELVNRRMSAGSYSVEFNAENLSSGVYLYRLHAEGFSATRKMILVK